MSATLIVQLVIAVLGQLPEFVKIIEELRTSGAESLTADQIQRAQAACMPMQATMTALWPIAGKSL